MSPRDGAPYVQWTWLSLGLFAAYLAAYAGPAVAGGLRVWLTLRRSEDELVAQVRPRWAERFDQAFSAGPGSPSGKR